MQAQKKQEMRHKIIWLGLILVCVGIIIGGINYFTMPKKVKVESLKYETVPFSYVERVQLTPTKLYLVKANVNAKIEKYLVEPGANVKEGQVLAQLDVEDIKRQMQQIEQGLHKQERKVIKEQQYDTSNKALLDSGVITKKEYEAIQRKQGGANQESVVETYVSTDEDMQLTYNKLAQVLNNPVIVASTSGELATFYNSEEKLALEDRPFAMIQQVAPLVATVIIPAQVDFQSLQAAIELGKDKIAAKISNMQLVQVDGDWQTIVTLSFPNLDYKLKLGENYKVHFEAPQSYRVLSVAANAVHEYQNDNYVYVLKPGNIIDVQSVEIGETKDGRTVILDGLDEGSKVVITDGKYSLGERVRT